MTSQPAFNIFKRCFGNTNKYSLFYQVCARVLNFACACILLIFFLPIMFLISVIILIDSPGNPIFLQERIGKRNRAFRILKFRTLYKHHFGLDLNQEEVANYRITKIGRKLRRSKLDELPQLWNIVLGDMNFIGPRPDIPQQVNHYLPEQYERLCLKPGLTGLSQICGNTLLGWPERIKLDIIYVRTRNLKLDSYILLKTARLILNGESSALEEYKKGTLTIFTATL